ncbi:hypothetical protein [Novosphingobium sp. THN1]|uniref:hypothetical protein n=1 Tax=Novosphingobium sp. THN1 TaxID=1016987 RepID=UPI0013C2F039|nr:hypothetical protein [Novosphingobium sp. THN1]
MRTIADAAGYTGLSDATITFNIPSGVTITGVGNGGIAIDSGTWPSASYTIALTIVVQNGGSFTAVADGVAKADKAARACLAARAAMGFSCARTSRRHHDRQWRHSQGWWWRWWRWWRELPSS